MFFSLLPQSNPQSLDVHMPFSYLNKYTQGCRAVPDRDQVPGPPSTTGRPERVQLYSTGDERDATARVHTLQLPLTREPRWLTPDRTSTEQCSGQCGVPEGELALCVLCVSSAFFNAFYAFSPANPRSLCHSLPFLYLR
jgi:hypothetical protein